MRTRLWIPLLGVIALSASVLGAPEKGSTVTVQVMNARLMKTPSFLGASTATLVRGDFLTFQEAQKDWYRVTNKAGKEGWINKVSVVEKKLALSSKPGGGTGGVSEDEVALAGRGFSPEVEKEYRKRNPNLDFSHVDNIEKLSVDPEQLTKFAQNGKVGGGK
jgi:hypothetical protein